MKNMKRLVALAAAVAMLGFSAKGVAADQYQQYAGGAGYMEGRDAPSLAPAIALGTIALIAIIAIALQNSDSGHNHTH